MDGRNGFRRNKKKFNKRCAVQETHQRLFPATPKYEKQQSIDGKIPNVLLYGELAVLKWVRGQSQLCFKDIRKSDMILFILSLLILFDFISL